MGNLSFGTYSKILKNATSLSNVAIVDLLVNSLINHGSGSIDLSDKHKLFNSNHNIQYLKDAASKIGVNNNIKDYFISKVIPEISILKINETIELLKALIIGDPTIVESDKNVLLRDSDREHLSEFLSKVFLFAATRENKLKDNKLPVPLSSKIIMISNGKIYLNGQEVLLPDKLIPPTNIEDEESIYITELLKTYAEKQKVKSFTIDNLPPKYKDDLNRHRQDYFSAEAVHRKVREIYANDENQFTLLKNETYDGVIDTASMIYCNGYEKLLNVLSQAVRLNHGKSLLWQLPEWISSSEKKGICHILVNDKRLTWVVNDEENI